MGAGVSGAANGLLGIVGLGGFWNPIDSSNLSQAQSALQATEEYWSQRLQQCQTALDTAQKNFLDQEIQDSKTQQAVTDEFLSERISSNSLVIGLLAMLVLFLVLYDLF